MIWTESNDKIRLGIQPNLFVNKVLAKTSCFWPNDIAFVLFKILFHPVLEYLTWIWWIQLKNGFLYVLDRLKQSEINKYLTFNMIRPIDIE